jgi:hypothetical protein
MYLFLVALLLASSSALAGTWRVELDGSGDFTTIQDALDAAAAGDSILVGPGEFTHSRLIPEWEGFRATAAIYKSGLKIIGSGADLTVVGEDTVDWYYRVFVSGDPLAPVNSLSVSDLTVRGGYDGIQYECDGLTVERCRFETSHRGIFGVGVDIALIKDCEFYNELGGIRPIAGSTNWTIANCTIEGGDIGISIDGAMGVQIRDCLVQSCDVGIQFYYSAGEIIRTQVIGSPDTENGVGIGSVVGSRLLLVDSVIDYTQNSTWWALSAQAGEFTGHGNQIRGGGNSSVDFFTNRQGNYTFDFHNNDIYQADEYALVLHDLDHNPSAPIRHFDLTNNYWGTTDPDSIAAWIDDANDHPGDLNYRGIVDFDPFLVDQVPVRKKSLSDIKGLFR